MYASRYHASRFYAARYYPKPFSGIEPPSDEVTVYCDLLGHPSYVLLLQHPPQVELNGLSKAFALLIEAP